MWNGMSLRRDDSAQGEFSEYAFLIGIGLGLVGLLLIYVGAWSFGVAFIGFGCLVGGFGGEGATDTPWGNVTGDAGIVLLVVAFLIYFVAHH